MTDEPRDIAVTQNLVKLIGVNRVFSIDQRVAPVVERIAANLVVAVPKGIGRSTDLLDEKPASIWWHHAEAVLVDKEIDRSFAKTADLERRPQNEVIVGKVVAR